MGPEYMRRQASAEYLLDVDSQWTLPGVYCDTCGNTWTGAPCSYPFVDLSSADWSGVLGGSRIAGPLSVTEYRRIARLIQKLIPSGRKLQPGTDFGKITGTARGEFPDLLPVRISRLLAPVNVCDRLIASGCKVPPLTSTNLIGADGSRSLFSEMVIPSSLYSKSLVAANEAPPDCGECGFRRISRIDVFSDLVFEGLDYDLVCIRYAEGIILGSERFVSIYHDMSLSGIEWNDIGITI